MSTVIIVIGGLIIFALALIPDKDYTDPDYENLRMNGDD